MKFITKRIHAFLDYPVALALIILPFILELGASTTLALKLSVATGIAAFFLTLVTDHHLGVFKVVSYKMHLMVDFIIALIFIIAPFAFSFEGIDAIYYWINGVAVLIVVSLHKNEVTSA